MPNPDPYTYFQVGSLYRRQEIHDLFGGQRQGGISTPSRSPVIFLFSSPRGEEFGYRDGWGEDGLFYYITRSGGRTVDPTGRRICWPSAPTATAGPTTARSAMNSTLFSWKKPAG